jgi:predicted phage terminase large subunit-like protein
VDDVAAALTAICKEHNPDLVLSDNDNAQKVFRTYALDSFRRHGVYAPLKELPTAGQDKQVRAASIRGFARQGRVKLLRGDWNAALLEECLGFPDTCRNDDQVDCMSLLGRYLAKMSPGASPQRQAPPPPIRGAISLNKDGNVHDRYDR